MGVSHGTRQIEIDVPQLKAGAARTHEPERVLEKLGSIQVRVPGVSLSDGVRERPSTGRTLRRLHESGPGCFAVPLSTMNQQTLTAPPPLHRQAEVLFALVFRKRSSSTS